MGLRRQSRAMPRCRLPLMSGKNKYTQHRKCKGSIQPLESSRSTTTRCGSVIGRMFVNSLPALELRACRHNLGAAWGGIPAHALPKVQFNR
jgi:hypothetical protein